MRTHSTGLFRITRGEHKTDISAHASATADVRDRGLPLLLSVPEAADLLRTSRRAIYAMIERKQLPGITRISRRVLLRTSELLNWLDQKRAPSLEE